MQKDLAASPPRRRPTGHPAVAPSSPVPQERLDIERQLTQTRLTSWLFRSNLVDGWDEWVPVSQDFCFQVNLDLRCFDQVRSGRFEKSKIYAAGSANDGGGHSKSQGHWALKGWVTRKDVKATRIAAKKMQFASHAIQSCAPGRWNMTKSSADWEPQRCTWQVSGYLGGCQFSWNLYVMVNGLIWLLVGPGLLVQASLRSKVEFIIVNLEFNLTWFVSSEFWHVLTTSFLGNYDWGIKPEMAEEFSGNWCDWNFRHVFE